MVYHNILSYFIKIGGIDPYWSILIHIDPYWSVFSISIATRTCRCSAAAAPLQPFALPRAARPSSLSPPSQKSRCARRTSLDAQQLFYTWFTRKSPISMCISLGKSRSPKNGALIPRFGRSTVNHPLLAHSFIQLRSFFVHVFTTIEIWFTLWIHGFVAGNKESRSPHCPRPNISFPSHLSVTFPLTRDDRNQFEKKIDVSHAKKVQDGFPNCRKTRKTCGFPTPEMSYDSSCDRNIRPFGCLGDSLELCKAPVNVFGQVLLLET